jgi:arsenical pump membrane protein
MSLSLITWCITALATAGVIFRPWRVPEYLWALGGALILVLTGRVPVPAALGAVARGNDVYLFLTGMMVLAELARREGLFDWLATLAARHARGSSQRLFDLVFLVGTLVTVFLSNDATAVVLTPAVYAAARAAKAEPLPYLVICAFIANAASFVLPISNPANLVIFGKQMPPLLQWLAQFGLPSLVTIGLTYAVLRWTQRKALCQPLEQVHELAPLPRGTCLTAAGLGLTAVLLLVMSALDMPLGLPTCLAGLATVVLVHVVQRKNPLPVLKGVAWGVLPLVAGLFVLVEALALTGVVGALAHQLERWAQAAPAQAGWGTGVLVAIACNLVNNLPAGLIAGSVGQMATLPAEITRALVIAVDLGPNLSVTGSLATVLWLIAVRREGMYISAWAFLKLGLLVMPPALLGALAMMKLTG